MEFEFIWKALGLCILTAIGCASIIFFNGKHDNPVEEVSEFLIEEITGVDIDLTPTSKEE